MKQEYVKQWVEALRSGEYKQSQGQLRTDEGYCCLGVLSAIVKDEIGGCWNRNDNTPYPQWEFIIGTDVSQSLLPQEIVELVGMQTNEGTFPWSVFDWSLIDMNDSGKSFEEIADVIEKHYEEL